MESPEITCPYCWQTITVEELPQIEGPYEFVTDCEVCCRPIRVTASWESGEGGEVRIDAQPES